MSATETAAIPFADKILGEQLQFIDINLYDLAETRNTRLANLAAPEGPADARDLSEQPYVTIPEFFRYVDVCLAVMVNGNVVVGLSSPGDPALYKRELGIRFARENAVDQIMHFKALERKHSSMAAPFNPTKTFMSSAIVDTTRNFLTFNLGDVLAYYVKVEGTSLSTFYHNVGLSICWREGCAYVEVGTSQSLTTEDYHFGVQLPEALAVADRKMSIAENYLYYNQNR